jgi:predicted O-methyltransferase YrrM
MNFKRIIFLIKNYFKYLLASKPAIGHGIHSPFIYKLASEVIRDKKKLRYTEIEKIRKQIYASQQVLQKTNYGAGSNSGTRYVGKNAKYSSITPKYGSLLRRLAEFYKPYAILEVGTSFGISTLYLATACPNSKVITLEGSEEKSLIAQKNFEILGLNNIKIVSGYFDASLPAILQNTDILPFVFFDGNHTYEATINYFQICLKKITEESIFIFDDIHWSEEMEKAWKYIQDNRVVSVTIDLYGIGVVLFRKGMQKQNFVIRF